jgi:hypothetical protein
MLRFLLSKMRKTILFVIKMVFGIVRHFHQWASVCNVCHEYICIYVHMYCSDRYSESNVLHTYVHDVMSSEAFLDRYMCTYDLTRTNKFSILYVFQEPTNYVLHINLLWVGNGEEAILKWDILPSWLSVWPWEVLWRFPELESTKTDKYKIYVNTITYVVQMLDLKRSMCFKVQQLLHFMYVL